MSRAADAEDRAAAWILAQEEDGWTARDEASLRQWLDASGGNRVAYLRLRHGWQEADRLRALQPGRPAERPVPRRPWSLVPLPRSWGSRQAAALAASLALIVGVAMHLGSAGPDVPEQVADRSFTTPVGGHRTVRFPEGSTIELNTASTIRTMISAERRDVWLDRGEAFFEVAHRDDWPFVVHAGNRRIVVLGTKFSVRRDGGEVTVSVLQGRVHVEEIAGGRVARSALIVAGDIAMAEGATTIVTTQSKQKVEDALAWRDGMLSFDHADLRSIAGEFNRYNERKLLIADAAAGSIRIGGRFPANDPDAFVRLLRDAYGLRVRENGGEIVVSD